MRTTMSTVYRNIQGNLNNITSELNRINSQISSGRQMSKISDNPVNLVSALSLRSSLVTINQYQDNIDFGNSMITAAEGSLTQIKELVTRAKILDLQLINDDKNLENRQNAAVEIHNLYEEAIILANTQINGKYIFGGYRTSGYTDLEPAPFVDGFIDGYSLNGSRPSSENVMPPNDIIQNSANIAGGDLLIDGEDMGAVDLTTAPLVSGLNMGGADNLKTAINGNSTNVTARLTTLTAGAATTAGGSTAISLDLSGSGGGPVTINFDVEGTEVEIGQQTIAAINAVSGQTGVMAFRGNGSNGGANNAVILRNVTDGDESSITLANLNGTETGLIGLADGSQAADATHNTGQIHLESSSAFDFGTTDSAILDLVGLNNGSIGVTSLNNNGNPATYGFNPQGSLAEFDLQINGINIPAATSDGYSTIDADSSAEAIANAINSVADQTGVTAEFIPVSLQASKAVENGIMHSGDLIINGIDIFTSDTDDDIIHNSADIVSATNPLLINAEDMGDIDLTTAPLVNGLNMGGANNLKTAINANSTNVTAGLTTLTAGLATTAGGPTSISLTLSGSSGGPVNITFNAEGTDTEIAQQTVAAINTHSAETGVMAFRGNGSNGGVDNAVVLRNVTNGDENSITLTNLNGTETGLIGLADGSQAADPSHNIGQIYLESGSAFDFGTTDSSILDLVGLNNGSIDVTSRDSDGNPTTYSFRPQGSIVAGDVDNALINAINAKEAQTGIIASRNINGAIILSPTSTLSSDNQGSGLNLHVETSANGEQISHLNGISPVDGASMVYKGSVELHSDRTFNLESPPFGLNNYESGLDALGVAGGVTVTGEPDDISGDGRIAVQYIQQKEGNVRYCGDRDNDIQIKVGKLSTIDVTKNGQDAIMDVGVFEAFKHLEDALMGINFRSVTGIHQAEDLNVTLDSGETGLEVEDSDYQFASGSVVISVTDYSYYPPRNTGMSIPIDITEDTLNSVATKINGVPGVMASWDDDTGHLQINSTDEERYTIALSDNGSNFLEATGTDFHQMQHQALAQSLDELDELFGSLTTQITNFGSKANRIQVQSNIYDNLKLATSEYLSEKQDTDFIEALMELKAKEVAYQAALSAAAKTMQVSLVDYL